MEHFKPAFEILISQVRKTGSFYITFFVLFLYHVAFDHLKCSCKHDVINEGMCITYMVIPALILLLLTLWMDGELQRVWRITCRCRGQCILCKRLVRIFMKAVTIALLWVVSVLFDGDWYVCHHRTELQCKNITDATSDQETSLKWKSKNLGALLLLSLLVGNFILTAILGRNICCSPCCSKSYYRALFEENIWEETELHIEKVLKKTAQECVVHYNKKRLPRLSNATQPTTTTITTQEGDRPTFTTITTQEGDRPTSTTSTTQEGDGQTITTITTQGGDRQPSTYITTKVEGVPTITTTNTRGEGGPTITTTTIHGGKPTITAKTILEEGWPTVTTTNTQGEFGPTITTITKLGEGGPTITTITKQRQDGQTITTITAQGGDRPTITPNSTQVEGGETIKITNLQGGGNPTITTIQGRESSTIDTTPTQGDGEPTITTITTQRGDKPTITTTTVLGEGGPTITTTTNTQGEGKTTITITTIQGGGGASNSTTEHAIKRLKNFDFDQISDLYSNLYLYIFPAPTSNVPI
ncbi:uncharacterized protein [Salvelinus alpinus]|uniref:uncharacterized protein isoform X1 n=1 Tax=Salvelinus alpinus TaxID=8036 RepID=UPI0039FC400F